MSKRVALIVGAGPGISGAFAKALVGDGYQVAMAARTVARLAPLANAIGARAFEVDAGSPPCIARLFAAVEGSLGGSVAITAN